MGYRFGFTGTRHGMTDAQKDALKRYLDHSMGEIHHGDCVGADSEAHDIAQSLGYEIIIHPPVDPGHRAWREVPTKNLWPEKTHFARNRDIVDETIALLAAPFEAVGQETGGTWYTVRYARKRGKVVILFLPDGTVSQK